LPSNPNITRAGASSRLASATLASAITSCTHQENRTPLICSGARCSLRRHMLADWLDLAAMAQRPSLRLSSYCVGALPGKLTACQSGSGLGGLVGAREAQPPRASALPARTNRSSCESMRGARKSGCPKAAAGVTSGLNAIRPEKLDQNE
jgi:hypothetical protein